MALAQLDRVFGYEPKGRGFESLTPRQSKKAITKVIAFLLWPPVGAREALRKNPVRDLAARVFSPRGILLALTELAT